MINGAELAALLPVREKKRRSKPGAMKEAWRSARKPSRRLHQPFVPRLEE
jgi:hypothetical protein